MSGHTILNPEGRPIQLPMWAIIRLSRLGLVRWNREQKRRQISAAYYQLQEILRAQHSDGPPLTAAAIDYSRAAGSHPRGGGRINGLYLTVGPDCSGPAVTQCRCQRCVNADRVVLRGERRRRKSPTAEHGSYISDT